MNYSRFSPEEFAADPYFRRWVQSPDPESNHFWEKWLMSHPEKRAVVWEARVLVLATAEKEPDNLLSDQALVWDRINATLNTLEQPARGEARVLPLHNTYEPFVHHKKRKNYRLWLSVAAMFSGLVVISLILFQQWTRQPEPEPEAWVVKEVPKGQKLKMYLPDGSEVFINSDSRIKYPPRFDNSARIVELTGEAFFDVKKDSLSPFIVRTGLLETKVLGTSFNINAYPENETASVALVSGSVTVESIKDNRKTTLVPGEQADVDAKSGKLSKGKFKDPLMLKWKDGVLVFNDLPLADVFRRIELWYGVNIQVKNELPSRRVTGVFEKEYLGNVLNSIQYVVDFDYTIKGDSLYVEFKPAEPMK